VELCSILAKYTAPLIAGIIARQIYFHIQTANFAGGEIRGQLSAIAPVPL
jgi:hypothetical protein